MFANEIIDTLILMFASGFAGIMVSVFLLAWSTVIWVVVAQKRDFHLNNGEEVSLLKGFIRIIIHAPYLVLFHPLPWVSAFIIYLGYRMLTGHLKGIAFWCALSFFVTPILNYLYQTKIRKDKLS